MSKLERWLTSGRGVVFLMALWRWGGRRWKVSRRLIIIYFLPSLFYLYLLPLNASIFFSSFRSRREMAMDKKKKTKKEKIEEKNKRKINLTIRRFCNSHVTSTLD